MAARKVELCGMDTSQLPVLSEAEKSRLIEAAHNGDQDARQQMIQGNLRLVLSVVQKFASRGENLDDLFQVGCIGLIKAIDNFDPSQKVRFSTYGVPMICGEVKRYLRDNNAVRVSRSIRALAYHSMQAREELQKRDGREPKISEIAVQVGASPENVAMALESAVAPTSLYEPVFSDGEDSFSVMDQLRRGCPRTGCLGRCQHRDRADHDQRPGHLAADPPAGRGCRPGSSAQGFRGLIYSLTQQNARVLLLPGTRAFCYT